MLTFFTKTGCEITINDRGCCMRSTIQRTHIVIKRESRMNFIINWLRQHQAWTLTRKYELNIPAVLMTWADTIRRKGKTANNQHMKVKTADPYYERIHFLSRLGYRQRQTCRKVSLSNRHVDVPYTIQPKTT